jgi:hypothetical protein
VIRIFGVYTHAHLSRLWESLGYQLARMGGKEYIARCRHRVYNRDGSRIVPAMFPPNKKKAGEDAVPIPELPKEDLEEVCLIPILNRRVLD